MIYDLFAFILGLKYVSKGNAMIGRYLLPDDHINDDVALSEVERLYPRWSAAYWQKHFRLSM